MDGDIELLKPHIMFFYVHILSLGQHSQPKPSAEDLHWFISVALPSFQNLVEANLGLPDSMDSAMVIRGLTQLDSLQLGVGACQISALQTFTSQSSLKVHSTSNPTPTFSLACLSGLRCLNFSGFSSDENYWALAIQLLCFLEELSLSYNYIYSKEVTRLAEVLKGLTWLQSLDLSGNEELGDAGYASVAKVIVQHTSLTELRLSGCCIEKEGATSLSEEL